MLDVIGEHANHHGQACQCFLARTDIDMMVVLDSARGTVLHC